MTSIDERENFVLEQKFNQLSNGINLNVLNTHTQNFNQPQSEYWCPIVFLHEIIYKLNAVKFSLIDSPAKKNKNNRFLCLSLRNRKTSIFFIFTLIIPQINQNSVFSQKKILRYGVFLKSMYFLVVITTLVAFQRKFT